MKARRLKHDNKNQESPFQEQVGHTIGLRADDEDGRRHDSSCPGTMIEKFKLIKRRLK